ncbi:antibiotic biosynthesis monooxygenase family protein [Haliangium sp.]|uniref:antibiotic biosynthesis monooxygenase family protein n=1 Tax=Haliangium sp. TaxID=2663208 RepID=UPI003D126DD1
MSTATRSDIGFCVIYRWRVDPDREDDFRRAWATVTEALAAHRGALGSRLHRAEDGTWVAYAQWPSKAAWEASRATDPVDAEVAEAGRVMAEAIVTRESPILLEPTDDRLR